MAVLHCLAFAGVVSDAVVCLILFVSYIVVHKKILFLLCFEILASQPENSNLKEKGGKSLSLRNKNFPYEIVPKTFICDILNHFMIMK